MIEEATRQDWPAPRSCVGACVITDAAQYTSIAERIGAAGTVEFLNRYLDVLFRPVFDNGGDVADVKGDGMLAVWVESPSADLRAQVCRACLQIAAASVRFFRSFPGYGLATRIGAFYGPIVLATVGTSAHREYRAVGDTVNTASRLEELNKELATRILVCANLAEGVEGFLFRDLGEFELRGKRNSVEVRELVGARDGASERDRRLCAEFTEAMQAQRRGRWHEALSRLRDLHARYPEDGPVRVHLERCQRLAEREAQASSPPFALTEAARLEAA